jgi:rhodanese-related sulfurtransferase
MPGPKHQTPRRPGPRPLLVQKGDEIVKVPRRPNRKQAAKLARRQAGYVDSIGGMKAHKPGSQNRKK